MKKFKLSSKKSWAKTSLHVFGMLIWVAASVIVAQLIVGKIMVLILGTEQFLQPVWTAIYSALSYVIAMILIILIPSIKFKTNRNELGLRGSPTWTDIGLAPVGFVIYLILAGGITTLFNLFPWFNATEIQELGFNVYVIGFDRIIAFITLVIVAPIMEEIIFRGWLYGKIRERLALNFSNKISMFISIFLVSLLFGIVHLQWNVGVNVFAMSIVLCGLREITGTIYSGILLHMLKNGVAFYLLYVLGVG